MKKISSLKAMIALALVFVIAVFPLAGCKKKLMPPIYYLKMAINNSIEDAKTSKYTSFMKNVLNGGAIELDCESSTILPIDLSLYMYCNEADGNYYYEISESDDLATKIYATKDAIAFDISRLEEVYGADIKNFRENFKKSVFGELVDIDELYDLNNDIEKVISSLKSNKSAITESFKNNANVTGEQIADSKYVIHVSLDSTIIANIIKDFYNAVFGDENFKKAIENIANSELLKTPDYTMSDDTSDDASDEEEKSFEESFEELLDGIKNGKLDVKCDLTIDKNNNIENTAMTIDFDFKDGDDTFKGNMQLSASKSECKVTAKTESTVEGEGSVFEYAYSQKSTDSEFTMESDAKTTMADTVYNTKFAVNYKDGAYTVNIEASGEEDAELVKAGISGLANISDDEMLFSIDKISANIFGADNSLDASIKLKLMAKADKGMPDMPEYKEITSLTQDEFYKIFQDLYIDIDPDIDMDDDFNQLSWPYERLEDIPEPIFFDGYICDIYDEGSKIHVNYSGDISADEIEDYVAELKDQGFTIENVEEDEMGEYSYCYVAGDDNGFSVGVYYYEDFGDCIVVVDIPEDKIKNYHFSSKHIPDPGFKNLEMITTTYTDVIATYTGVSASEIIAYEETLKTLGFTKSLSTSYDELGEYDYTAQNAAGNTVVLTAVGESDDENTKYNVYLIIMDFADVPGFVPEFDKGDLASSTENGGVLAMTYSDTTLEDARSYIETLIDKGYALIDDSDRANSSAEYYGAVVNADGYEIHVYYLGDGFTGIMMGYLSE